MIDSSEPKDGDYVRYVESLVNAPKAQQLPEASQSGWGRGGSATAQGVARDADPGAVAGRFPRQPAGPDGGATRPDATRLDGGATRRDPGGAQANAGATRPASRSGPSAGESLEARLKRLREALPHASGGGTDADLAGLAGAVGNVLRRVAPITSFLGLATILLSFVDEPPFFANPAFGILLIAIGAMLKRLARKLG